MLNKQQLITQCREILAEAEYQEEWCVNMAAALLPCLEAKPVFFVEIEGDDWTNSGRIEGDERPDLGLLPEGINHLYVAPPVPELKLPDLGSNEVNDAAWKLHDTITEFGPLNGHQFNNLKGCMYEAFKVLVGVKS